MKNMKQIFKLVLFFIWALSPLSYAANEPPAQKQEETVPELRPEETPHVEVPVPYKGAFVKMILTLLGLIILIVLSVWMLRRVAQGKFRQLNQGRIIKVLERRPLSAKSVLYVVEVANKKVLISESQLEVRAIASVDEISHSDEG